jgi:hypothetical protein
VIKKSLVLDKKIENLEQEESLDKAMLHHLCSDMMEEVMDLVE